MPPRYRRRKPAPAAEAETVPEPVAAGTERVPVPAGINGATAIGNRARFTDRRKAGTPS